MLSLQMPRYGTGQVEVANNANLNALSYGISQLISWGLGCGAHRLTFKAVKNRIGISVFMDPEVEPQVISAAGCCTMQGLHEMDLLPRDIPQFEQMNMDGSTKLVKDGQARFSFKPGDGSLIQTYDVRPDISLAAWAFAYSDHITGFIWRGVREVKLFHSMKLTQVYLSPAVPDNVVRAVMTNAEDYPQNTLISSIK